MWMEWKLSCCFLWIYFWLCLSVGQACDKYYGNVGEKRLARMFLMEYWFMGTSDGATLLCLARALMLPILRAFVGFCGSFWRCWNWFELICDFQFKYSGTNFNFFFFKTGWKHFNQLFQKPREPSSDTLHIRPTFSKKIILIRQSMDLKCP